MLTLLLIWALLTVVSAVALALFIAADSRQAAARAAPAPVPTRWARGPRRRPRIRLRRHGRRPPVAPIRRPRR